MGEGTVRGRRAANAAASGLGIVVLVVAALLFVLRPLSITLPAAGLDSSWMAVLGEAATHGARWGVDLAFTYGPASAWVTRYFTAHYLTATLPPIAGLAVVNSSAVVLLARRAAEGRRSGAILVVVAVAAEVAGLGAELALDQDSFYFALAFLLLLLDLVRQPGRRVGLATVVAGAALLGAAAMAKTSFGIASLGLLALADARALWARRRIPILVPVCGAAALGSFLLHGQHLADLPAYLSLQSQEATGYGEAMYLVPGRFELGLYAVAAAGLTGLAWFVGPRGHGGRAAAALGTAFVLAIGIKAGFIRADTHTQIAWSLLGLAGLGLAIGLVPRASVRGAALLGAAALAVLWIVGPLFLLVATEQPVGLTALQGAYHDMGADAAVEAGAWRRFVERPSAFLAAARAAKAESWAAIRAADPMPHLDGPVDTLPSVQNAVLAAGLDYRPRPSFQEYSTYTDGLLAANRDFLEGSRAPAWVLVGREPGADSLTIDGRYPSLAEGSLWPDLLALYRPERRIGDLLALHRRASPLDLHRGKLRRGTARLGEEVPVDGEAPAVFATVDLRPTLLGRIAGLLFRPALSSLDVTLADGTRRSYRFVSGIGRSGFVLSPLVTDADDFAALAEAAPTPPGRRVVAFAVSGNAALLAPDLSYTLQPMAPAPPAGPAPPR